MAVQLPLCMQWSMATTDAPIIGWRLSAILPIIGIGQLIRWYQPIVIYRINKGKGKGKRGFV